MCSTDMFRCRGEVGFIDMYSEERPLERYGVAHLCKTRF